MSRWIASIAVALVVGLLPTALASAAVEPYRAKDFLGFHDILPPGENGLANAAQVAAFEATGARPPHSDDQRDMYANLVYGAPDIRAQDLGNYFKDSSFGVPPGDVARSYSPRPDVVIQRDSDFGVPHVYGQTRAGAMFGLGYATAEDRLFFIDVLRHYGRCQLSELVGGSSRGMDEEQWADTPYTDADFDRQYDQLDDLYGADGRRFQEDGTNYVAGINQYIAEAKLNPNKMPDVYAAVAHPEGPRPWNFGDVIAEAALVGGIFGKGGGGELQWGQLLQSFRKRFGSRLGTKLWRGFRSAEDPEAPVTVHRRKFPYERPPRHRARGSVALPDQGSLTGAEVVESRSAGAPARRRGEVAPWARGLVAGLRGLHHGASNALLVSARESKSGHPLAVMGPQVSYLTPQILMEQDVHAPTIDARGAAFPGVNLYVELGRGRDYSWSATSAGQDNIDIFAVDLCEPGGGSPTKSSMGYVFRGRCEPIEVLRRTNSWVPSATSTDPPGSETLRAERTKLGIVTARGTIHGKPVAFTRLRSTYLHEVDSARGFSDFNDPDKMRGPRDFQRAASKIGYTFNWFYADDRHIAYFNSGANPARAKGTDPLLPVRGRFEWKRFDPANNTAAMTPFRQHPRVIDQAYLTSWNNKQARAYRAGSWDHGPVDRSEPLDDRIKRGIRGRRKMSLIDLVNAMGDAGTVDLRADKVLPWALKVIGRPRDRDLAAAVDRLRAWMRDGSHRRDRNRDGVYEHTDAIATMDAWWPLWMKAQFEPLLGAPLYKQLTAAAGIDDENRTNHIGSAFDDGWWGYAQKDLRTLLHRRVRGRYARIFCGKGSRARCREALERSLAEALKVDRGSLYAECADRGRGPDQMCDEEIRFRAVDAVTQPAIPWINRPTYQQAVEIQGHR